MTRIAFAGVGKYNEFDQLRIAGVRHADLKGFSFSREDVDARSLANQYAQSLGQVFTHEMKPMEVEILVAEIGHADDGSEDQLFHILYDGTVVDEDMAVVLGGETDTISDRFGEITTPTPGRCQTASGRLRRLSAVRTASSPRPTSKWRCSSAALIAVRSVGSRTTKSALTSRADVVRSR